jgi:hypothetical protein
MHMHRKRQPGGFAGTFVLRAMPMRPNEAKSRCLSTIRNQGRAEEYFERSLNVAPQQQQLC